MNLMDKVMGTKVGRITVVTATQLVLSSYYVTE